MKEFFRHSNQGGRLASGAVLLLLFVYLLPTGHAVLFSFGIDDIDLKSSLSLSSYADIDNNSRLLSALRASIVCAAIVSVVAVGLCWGGIQSFTRYTPKVQRVLLTVVLLPLFVPETTHAVILSACLAWLDFPKGAISVGLGQLVYVIPFTASIILLQVSSFSQNLTLAAQDLGLSVPETYRHITLPMMWPSLMSAGMFSFFLAFNEYTRTLALEEHEMYSVFLRGQLAAGGTRSVYAVSSLAVLLGGASLIMISLLLLRRSQAWRRS